ncbi:hypothetical protein MAR_035616 [Mya arenaria]|uniref:Uncharacterized protein n=1 Tax=Mya arenaria TaxID=6604 RepID=A0ABY7EMU3_MYAAR|nr:uncharacterized protein LOC128240136 [Mya arenaria]WAR10540.1 hypothetical protein MAR_035616 [Mya arenaria]
MESSYLGEQYDKNDSFFKTKTSLQSNGTIRSNKDKESGNISEITAEVNVTKMNGASDGEELGRQLPVTMTASSDKAGKLLSPPLLPSPGGHTLQRLEPEGSDAPTESGPGVKGEFNRAQHETVEHYAESHRPEDAPSKQSTRVSLVATLRETPPPTENTRMSDGSEQNTGSPTRPSSDSTKVEQESRANMSHLTSKQRPPSRTSYNLLDSQSEEQGPEGDAQSAVQVEISSPKPMGESQESVQHIENSKIDSPDALIVPENRTRTSPEGLDHSSDEKGSGGKYKSADDELNPYFTGRLPTLLLREQTIQPANEKFSHGRANQDSTRELNTAKEKSQETRREQTSADKDDKDALTYSPTNKQDTHTPKTETRNAKTEHDTKNVTDATPSSNSSAIPMSSREVQDILNEIKSDSHKYALVKEKPLTPRNNKEKEGTGLSVIHSVAEENGVNLDAEENRRGQYEGSRMTLSDIDAVTSKVVGTTHVKDRQSYFDNLPQVKNIDSYVAANKLPRENSEVRVETTNERSKETHDVNQYERNTTENTEGRTSTKTPDSHGSTAGGSDYRKDMLPQIEKSTQLAEVDEKPPLRDSEEVALRDIIASAKRAIDQGHESEEETDDTLTELATTDASRISVHGSHVSQVERASRGGRQERRESEVSTTVDEGALICSNCMRADSNVHSSGFCGVCKKYLCSTCITVHTMDSKTSHHEILACYCKNELGINKYVKATAYCSDCVAFLCSKCSLDHVGKRIYKRHRVIQSSFVMKPHNKKTSSMQFLNNIQDHFEHELAKRTSRSDKSRKEKQRKSMIEKQRSNPYKVAYSNVLPSLYPGPNKALGASYANNPNWPQTSIPSLPYLVQPGPLRQRLLDNPYITQHRPLGYAGGKEINDTLQDVKLKQMKSRYGVREIAQVFKLHGGSRPISRLSMTPAGTMKSFTTHGRTEGGVTVNIYPEPTLMHAEYLNEKNLSIPFPSGEKPVEISAMVILMNGHLVVFDKNNNNIKIYNKTFRCKAALQFHNRIVDIAASNLCPTDIYTATPRHMYEISSIKGLELTKKFNVGVRRIEGLACWKYGLVVISKQTEITWELRLFDYRGNVKSKLEVLNPFTSDIAANKLYHVTTSRGGKYLSISDAKNGCVITIDLLGRKIAAETNLKQSSNDATLEELQEETDASSNTADNKNVDVTPTYLTSDSNDNVYVSCDGRVLQVSRRGDLVGTVIDVPGEGRSNGSIVFNRSKKRLYVQTGTDSIIVYKIHA